MPTASVASPVDLGLDEDTRYRAVTSRDSRFDGMFITAVLTTGIYCRPSCPARTPRRTSVRFFRTAAAAQAAGFRACRRCRPDAVPGSPEWDLRADVVARAVRLIDDGLLDREGVAGLSARLGYSSRQVHRLLTGELGAGPLALARAGRAGTARVLLETTAMPAADVAFAAGFGSVRQFNDTVREVFALTPRQVRERARSRAGRAGADQALAGEVVLRLPVRPPFAADRLLAFLAARAVPGVETCSGDTYRRAVRLPRGHGVVALTLRPAAAGEPAEVRAALRLEDLRDLGAAVARCRRLLDLDADPVAVDAVLSGDPALRPSVRRSPGLRVPGTTDGAETALRAVLGQQVSVAAARTAAAALVGLVGEPLRVPDQQLTTVFPEPARVASLDPEVLSMPRARARTVVALAAVLAAEPLLEPGADRGSAESALLAVPGVGPWTAAYVRMRVAHDPDVLLTSDLAARRGAAHLGLPSSAAALQQHGRRWRPWSSYALLHLWENA